MSGKIFCIDLDGTLLFVRKQIPQNNFVLKNPMLGVIRDLMVETGCKPRKAVKIISKKCEELKWWDYPDLIAEFELTPALVWDRIEDWQQTYLTVCEDAVAMVRELRRCADAMFVVSNNPTSGCLIKLKLAGLGGLGGSSVFDRVLGVDLLKGMKHYSRTWRRLIAQVNCDPASLTVIGDHPMDDGEVPLSCGIGRAIIIERQLNDNSRKAGPLTFVRSPQEALKLLKNDA